MIVLKFGGTSVRDAAWINRALDIASRQLDRGPLLVASACGDTTDRLNEMSEIAVTGDADGALELLEQVRKRHLSIADELLADSALSPCQAELEILFTELGSILGGIARLKECTLRTRDLILSFGEMLSTRLIASRSTERGIETRLLDSRQLIRTDDTFGHGLPLEEPTTRLIHEHVKPAPGRLYIAQGFVASTMDRITSTLGRGGSDYSATIFGAALEAEEVQIWTDVDGVMTADPREVAAAATLSRISYQEAAELAYFGARVIHPATIQPAIARGIPVWVRNTGNPESPGTEILPAAPAEGPKAVASKDGITLISVTSGRMLLAYGFLKRIFEIFERHQTSVDLVATSEVSVSVTIDDSSSLEAINRELQALGSVQVEHAKSIICLVGHDLWKNPETVARVFMSLRGIRIRLISLGSSDTNLSIVVPEDSCVEAVRRLHAEFFENGSAKSIS
jgi:aspartate kinase